METPTLDYHQTLQEFRDAIPEKCGDCYRAGMIAMKLADTAVRGKVQLAEEVLKFSEDLATCPGQIVIPGRCFSSTKCGHEESKIKRCP